MSAKGTSSFHQHVIDTGDVCSICLDSLDMWTGFVRLTCCGKRIHEHCYNELQESRSQNKCPLCRKTMAKTLEDTHSCCLRWAARGKAWAMYQVGENFYLGRGVAQEQRMAQLWFRKAAEKGSPHAQFSLGLMYARGEGGLSVDIVEALVWLKKAALHGHPKAKVLLDRLE